MQKRSVAESQSACGFIVEMMRFKSVIDPAVKRARSTAHPGTFQCRTTGQRTTVAGGRPVGRGSSHIAGLSLRFRPAEYFDDPRRR